jgi:hypothetical protein
MVHKRKPPSCNGGGSLRTPLGEYWGVRSPQTSTTHEAMRGSD